jgi:hypothetical protein
VDGDLLQVVDDEQRFGLRTRGGQQGLDRRDVGVRARAADEPQPVGVPVDPFGRLGEQRLADDQVLEAAVPAGRGDDDAPEPVDVRGGDRRGEHPELEHEQTAEHRGLVVLVGDVDRDAASPRRVPCHLERRDGLADARAAAEQEQVVDAESTLQDPVEQIEPGRDGER